MFKLVCASTPFRFACMVLKDRTVDMLVRQVIKIEIIGIDNKLQVTYNTGSKAGYKKHELAQN